MECHEGPGCVEAKGERITGNEIDRFKEQQQGNETDSSFQLISWKRQRLSV